MSPRFDEVRRLADLEKRAEPNWIKGDMGNIYSPKSPTRYPLLMPYGINASSVEVQIAVDLRNAAPWLLVVAGCFRPGDADLLDESIAYINFLIPSGMEAVEVGDEEFEVLLDDQKLLIRAKDHLFRMLAAAKIMEERE